MNLFILLFIKGTVISITTPSNFIETTLLSSSSSSRSASSSTSKTTSSIEEPVTTEESSTTTTLQLSTLVPQKQIVFVAELCCTLKKSALNKIVDINDSSKEIAIRYNDSTNELLIIKDEELINALALPANELYLTFILINGSGYMNIYIGCNNMSNPDYILNTKIDLNTISYEMFDNVHSFKSISKAFYDYKCNAKLTVLSGSILYFYNELKSNGTNIISFMHNSRLFFMCYKNNQIHVKNNRNNHLTTISLDSNHNFTYGLYLYFKRSSIEIYDECPITIYDNSFRVGIWNTTIFYDKLIIKTYKNFILSNAANQHTLGSFCNNANLYKSGLNNLSSCYQVNNNLDLFQQANNIFMNYFPAEQKMKKISTLMSLNNLYVVNEPTIVFASRNNSEYSFFDRTIEEYENGFSDGQYNFWLGLSMLHNLTNSNSFRLRIFARSKQDINYVEEYSLVRIAGKKENYRLMLGKLDSGKNGFFSKYNNTDFSTKDFGVHKELAESYQSGFWHKEENNSVCFNCVLNVYDTISSTTMSLSNAINEEFNTVKMILVVRRKLNKFLNYKK